MNLAKIGNIETEVKVITIVEALEKFKAQHVLDYEETVKLFEAKFEEKRAEVLKIVKKAEPGKMDWIQPNFGLTVPVNNVEMYDNYISTFKAVSSDTLTLSITELNTIITNSWDWVTTANNSFVAYNAKFAG